MLERLEDAGVGFRRVARRGGEQQQRELLRAARGHRVARARVQHEGELPQPAAPHLQARARREGQRVRSEVVAQYGSCSTVAGRGCAREAVHGRRTSLRSSPLVAPPRPPSRP